jgi:uncharacterized alkaline shock family protein YloU
VSRVLSHDARGSVRLSEAALAQIVGGAVGQVEGARLRKGRRRLALELADGHAHAQLELAVAHGRVIPEVAHSVQARVADALARMCALEVDGVDVNVVELDS